MDDRTRVHHSRIFITLLTAAVIAVSLLAPIGAQASDPVTYALSDVRVLYVFDNPETIDWPTLFYLNDNQSCRIDLLTTKIGGEFRVTTADVPGREIYLHTAYLASTGPRATDSLFAALFADRRPDIVMFGTVAGRELYAGYENYLRNMAADSGRIFNILKIYHQAGPDEPVTEAGTVVLNGEELFYRFHDRMELEIPKVLVGFSIKDYQASRLVRYRLVSSAGGAYSQQPEFLSGIAAPRLAPVIENHIGAGQVRDALVSRARNFISFFTLGENSTGRRRAENLVTGYKELIALQRQLEPQTAVTSLTDYAGYMNNLQARAQAAVLGEIGVDWSGQIILRDSPHGPKLKFLASLTVNGPQEVELSYILFHPYWDTAAVTLDSVSRKIEPHQSFVREYLVDIDRSRLESKLPDSLRFSAELVYSQIQLPVVSSIPVRETPNLAVSFQPDFHFVPPVARVNIDKVVSSMNWKAVISKPISYSGTVTLKLQTPRGVFAGAYRTEWQLEKGRTTETVRIPFSVSNLFEMGIQPVTISLIVDNRDVATDTAYMRIAACEIADTLKIGFLPDSTGTIEDILRMTNAGFQPLTDRSLLTADLESFNVIIIGSGAFHQYPSLANVRGRIEDYLRQGGSLVVLGQPTDWPEGILPVSLVPGRESVAPRDVSNRIPAANILSSPYKIDQTELLSYLDRRPEVAPAVISPAQQVLVTPSGATLLSVSRLGDGQIIYCGLPLSTMIAGLNLEAIHLFANILNY